MAVLCWAFMAGLSGLAVAQQAEVKEPPANETRIDPASWLRPVPTDFAGGEVHGALYERWEGVKGETVWDLLDSTEFRQAAPVRGLTDLLEFPAGDGRDFGVRVRGYVVPSHSGKVRFIVSSDDNSELWLSKDRDPMARRKIAWITGPGWFGSTPPYFTGRIATQWSEPIEVKAGEAYYFEAYHKEAAGDDHFEILWQFEDDKEPAGIPTEALRPWTGAESDLDDDGLPDEWQTRTGLAGRPDRGWWQDADGDRVTNFEEFIGGSDPLDARAREGFLLWEIWYGVWGQDVADLVRDPRFLKPAHRSVFIEGSVTPALAASHFGSRLSGCLVPKETAVYELAVSGDDAVELWLSDGPSQVRKTRVAFNDHWRGKPAAEEWGAVPAQRTAPVELKAGQAYYFEILQKDRLAPGWAALGWRKQGEKDFVAVGREFFRSPGADPQDANGDFLPDAWTSKLLGAVAEDERRNFPLTEFGDPDHDGLANWQEARLGTDPWTRDGLPGAFSREWWFNVPGVSLARARQSGAFLKPPSMVTLTPGAAGESNTVDYFASRLRGRIVAPVEGTYRFWIAGDDHCELWLSQTERKFYKEKIASITPENWENPDTDAWTQPLEWDSRPQQESAGIPLRAGEARFVEILHKEAGDKDHVAVAWQYRPAGSDQWSERMVIPVEAIASYAGDDDDLDDDYLPDSWEAEKGLDPTDNGVRDPVKQGEDGDFDGDKLTNREEFLRGTHPCLADSDGDGVGDYEEIHIYGSDPVRKDASPPVKLGTLPLSGYQAEPGEWFVMPDGTLRSLQRRGPVDFAFELEKPGVYLLELEARVGTSGDYAPPVPVIARVDGTEVGRGNIEKTGTTWRWLTPWLPAGRHTVTIDNRNVRLGLTLDIVHLDLYRHEGEDADGNALPDWMEGLFRRSSQLDSAFVESTVSPFCVEGVWRFSGDAGLAAAGKPVEVKAGLAGHWYADVPLAAEGETPVEARFEHGALKQTGSLRWKETNLLAAAGELRVRVGDSLKLVAVPAGTDGAQTQVLYSLDQEALGSARAGNQPRVVKFSKPGSYTLKAATTTGSETLDAEVEVEVLAADFGAAFSVAAGTPRTWSLPGVPHALSVESDTELSLDQQPLGLEKPLTYQVSYPAGQSGQPAVLARLWSGGPVMAATRVNAFWIVPATQTLDSRLVQVLPDGTRVVEFAILVEGVIPADFSLWIDFYVTDAVFADGSTRYHLTAADFDEDGIARILVYKAPGTGTAWICHWLRPYQEEGSPPAVTPALPAAPTAE